MEFLVSTGCRLSEVAQLRAADLDLVGPVGAGHRQGRQGPRGVLLSVRARLMVQEYFVAAEGRRRPVRVSSKSPYEPAQTAGDPAC